MFGVDTRVLANMKTPNDPRTRFTRTMWSKADVCTEHGIGRSTLENWMKRGLVPYYKIGGTIRFNVVELRQALIARRLEGIYRVPPAPLSPLDLSAN
jgi:hypothetical protein